MALCGTCLHDGVVLVGHGVDSRCDAGLGAGVVLGCVLARAGRSVDRRMYEHVAQVPVSLESHHVCQPPYTQPVK